MWWSSAFLEIIWHDCIISCLLRFRSGLQSDEPSFTFEKRFHCFCFHPLLCLWRKTDNLQPMQCGFQNYLSQFAVLSSPPHLMASVATSFKWTRQQREAKTGRDFFLLLTWTKTCKFPLILKTSIWETPMPLIFPQILWPKQVQTNPESISTHCLLMRH